MPGGRAVAVLAHQGGWDEILLVAGPIVLVVALLTVVKRRVDAAADERDAATDERDTATAGNITNDAATDDVTRR